MSKFCRPEAALVLLACLWAGCSAPVEPARHLLLVTLDTTRADRLGCYGFDSAGTPTLDRLAAQGTRIDRAYATAPLTLPSHMSLFTGLDPPRTGVHSNERREVLPDVKTLAEILGESGFFTTAAVGGYPVSARFPVARGFEQFDDRLEDPRNASALERDAGLVVQAALTSLEKRNGRRTFLWVHFYDPHDPYEPPPRFRERYADAYQGEIARVDEALGALLAGLEASLIPEGLLVSVVADHGEGLGEHGEPTHGYFLYEPTVRVPWILAGPKVPQGRVLPGPASLVDAVPTLLELLDLPVPEDLDGIALDWSAAREREPLYIETELPREGYGYSPLRAAVSGSLKYIEAPRPELYDLAADPREEHSLVDRHPRSIELADWVAEHGSGSSSPGGSVVDPALASLGYVGSGATGEPSVEDPKDGLEVYLQFQTAGRLLETGRAADALQILDRLVASEPGEGAHFKRAVALRMLGRTAEAETLLLDLEQWNPADPRVQLELGRIALWDGRAAAALASLDGYLRAFPDHAEALLLRGAAREGLGDPKGAEIDYRNALIRNPAYRDASLRLAALLVSTGRIDEAKRQLASHLGRHADDELARGLLQSL